MRILRPALVLLLAFAAGPPVQADTGRFHIVSLAPTGEVRNDAPRTIEVQFDRPMVDSARVGVMLATSPLMVSPALAGQARWRDRQTLVYRVTGKASLATEYRVTLAPDLRAADGSAAEKLDLGQFVNQPIELDQLSVKAPRSKKEREYPELTLGFNQPVAPELIEKSCYVDGNDQRVRLRVKPGRNETTELLAQPTGALKPDADYHLACDTALHTIAAGLGRYSHPGFHTAGALRLSEKPDSEVDPSRDEWIHFSTLVDPKEAEKHLALRPLGAKVSCNEGFQATSCVLSNLRAATEYVATIDRSLRDRMGQTLEGDNVVRFRVGDFKPGLHAERGMVLVEAKSGRLPVWARNIDQFQFACATLPEARLSAALSGKFNYDSWYEASDSSEKGLGGLGAPVANRTIKVSGHNKWIDSSVDLLKACPRGGAGHIYAVEMTSSASEYAVRTLANVTDIGLLAKVGNASSLVWAVRLSTGEPIAGAAVRIRNRQGKVRFEGKTGADGSVLAPGAVQLLGIEQKGKERRGWDELRQRRVIVTVEAAGDLAVLDTAWNNGVQAWNFGFNADQGGGKVRIRGFLQSDRGLYRPGETVHLRGLVRAIESGGAMHLPTEKKLHLMVEDPRGKTWVEDNLTISAFGGFSRDLVMPAEARLGDYRVTGSLGGQTFSDTFSVEEYRPRTFEVKLDMPADQRLGEPIKGRVSGSYLYGAPMKGASVRWEIRARRHHPRFKEYDVYTFEDWAADPEGGWWARWRDDSSTSELVADGEQTLDAQGAATFAGKDVPKNGDKNENKSELGPKDYLVSATVKDSSGQSVTANRVVVGHRSSVYLGLHVEEFVQATEMPFAIQTVALSQSGQRTAATAELVVLRRNYHCGDSSGSWRCDTKDEEVVRRPLQLAANGGATVERVVLHQPGEHVIRVRTKAADGSVAVASDSIYVIGKGEAFWSGDEGDRLTVVTSKASYRPGETARLVPQANLGRALALVTVERDGIMKSFVTRIAPGEGIELPIEADYAPNVFASVTLLRGRTADNEKGRPRFKMGLVNLAVEAGDRALKVAIATDKPSYRPGETVTAELRVAGSDGAPVVAELAVAAADEGVLQIKGYETPNPLKNFYAAWDLGVENATTWNRLAVRRAPDESEAEEEGDSGGDGPAIRSRFVATAFWAPAIVTGSDGKALVRFKAPDNLTAFRIMAVGADAGRRFGSGEQRFTVRKPLLVMQTLPRFLTTGDTAWVGGSVHNNTQQAGHVRFEAKVEGAAFDGKTVEEFDLAAGAERPVRFALHADKAGTARFRFLATMAPLRAAPDGSGGTEKDGVEQAIPIERPLVRESVALGQGTVSGPLELKLPPAANVVASESELDVVVDRTGMAPLAEGLRYLVDYPYGCAEQTTAKVVAMLALDDLAASEWSDRKKLKGFVEAGLRKLVRHQNDDGGFGLWIGSSSRDDVSAYALWGLETARRAGYRVDKEAMRRGTAALEKGLRAQLDNKRGLYGELGERAFALAVLASMGPSGAAGGAERSGTMKHGDVGVATQLFEQRTSLPEYGKLFLAQALHRLGQDDQSRTVIGEVVARIPQTTPYLVSESASYGWYFSTNLRTTAIALATLLEVDPKNAAVPLLTDSLLATQKGGRWYNTEENLFSLLALSQVARQRSQAAASDVRASLDGGATWQKAHLSGNELRHFRWKGPKAAAATALRVEAGGAPIYYAANLRVARPMSSDAATSEIAVERSYLDPATNQPLTTVKLGQVVKVQLHLSTKATQPHVALVDPLPAGLEPILNRFEPPAANGERGEDEEDWRERWTWESREFHDDRAEFFSEELPAGESTIEYLARATTPGKFQSAPATAEAMYEPGRFGRTRADRFTVTR